VVAHLVRLKLTLLRNGLRRSPWKVVGLVVGVLYTLGLLVAVVIGLVALGSADRTLIRTVLTLAGGLLVLGWWIVPLLATGVDATLDPTRFVTFAIRRRSLLTGLALGGVVGLPGIATAIVALATTLTWLRHPLAALAAGPCALLGLATCVVGARATTTALSSFVGRRRYREIVAAIAIVPLMLLGPGLTAVMRGLAAAKDDLPNLAAIVGWTPWGAVWAIPADVAAGAWVNAGLKAAIALATLVGLVAVWAATLSRALVAAPSSGRSRPSGRSRTLGAFGWLPATPTGAVAARSLTYWFRDPRYTKALIIAPVFPVLMYFTARNAGGGNGILLLTGPVIGFILGWTISADIAYDGTAFWTHLAAPITGRVDRAGRAFGAAIVCLPAALLLAVASVAVAGRWEALLPLIGASVGIALTALGGASLVSAQVVYQVPKAGESAFSSQQGAGMAAFLSQIAGWGIVTVASLPEIVLAAFAVGTGSVLLGVCALVVGVGLGAAALVVGVRVGGRMLDARAPELLERLVSFG